MKVIESVSALREWRKSLPANTTVGFVPTMGALHDGHASLLKQARAKNSVVVLSIFVNPTQFNNAEDFSKYPNTFDADLAIARAQKVDVVFAPARPVASSPDPMYPDNYRYQISEKVFSHELCGEHRPGHFEGVLTVVMKLFSLVKPTRAYFGEKDHQQLTLIQGMIDAFFLDVELVPCETVREESGLAMSSRNLRLTPEERILAPKLKEIMSSVADPEEATQKLNALGFKVEYIVDKNQNRSKRRYAAAWLGKVRLIDNVTK